MNFHCLGTNGFHPTESSHTACYMIPEIGVVFDAGSGFFRVSTLVQTKYLEIFLSHCHMDHICGIHCLLELLRVTDCKTVRIYGEQHVIDAVKTTFQDPFFPSLPEMDFIPIQENVQINLSSGAVVTPFKVKHTTSCHGYRLEYNGKKLAYVTDTSSNPESGYLKYLENLDFLFHEVHSITEESSVNFGHTDANNLAKICNIIKPGQLVTIHHNPMGDRYAILEHIKKEYPNTITTEDKKIIPLL